MSFCSPLRYPGGKNKLAKFIALICKENNITGHYVEPYAGGAAVAIYLLLNGYVSEISINDVDRSIYAFWYSILNHTTKFCNQIRKTEVSIENWHKYRNIQDSKKTASLFDLGFSTFFQNRTNMSGIIAGGVIGGLDQKGKYKLNCRFNKDELIRRIKEIAKHKRDIHLYNLDALELIKTLKKQPGCSQTIFYLDPPYYLKGKSLYVNYYEHKDHEKMSRVVKGMKNFKWVVSYDNTKEIKKMYKPYKKKEYSFFHMAHKPKQGLEVLFFSKNLIVPRIVEPTKV